MNKSSCKTAALLILLLVLASPCLAVDWFVRPADGSPSARTGKAYEDAWRGFRAIKWGQIQPGDNLYICDTHVGDSLTIGVSGTEGLPVTIRGDYPDHPGVIIGASAVLTDGWELHDAAHNIWKHAFSAPSTYSDWHAFERHKTADPVEGIVRLNNVGHWETAGTGEKLDFSQWKPGTYYKEGNVLYYRPTSGSANDYVYYAGYSGPCVTSFNQHHFSLVGLRAMMGAGSQYGGVIRLKNLHHVTVDNVTVRWGVYGIIFSPEWSFRKTVSSDYVTVSNCTISNCRAGIYPFGEVNHCLITGNHIYDIDQYGYYVHWKQNAWSGDIHGIALQGGGNDLRIEHNHVHNAGSEGIFPYGDNNPEGVNVQRLENFSIKYNLVHDIKYLGGPVKQPYYSSGMQSALYYNQNNNFPSEGLSNNVMAYNILYNAGHGVRMKCNTNKETGKAPWAVYNNVIFNTDVGVCWYSTGQYNTYNKPGVVFKNNVVLGALSRFVSIAPSVIKEYDQLIFDSNIYYPDMAEGFQWPEGRGSFADWKNWGSSKKLDQHSMVCDPNFTDAERHDFQLKEDSPAIDSGQLVGITEDYSGHQVPTGQSPDIGAFEYLAEFISFERSRSP